MGTNELTTTELEALAAKLDGLDLTDAEQTLLLAVFDSVVDPSGWVGADVHGFGMSDHPHVEPEPLSTAFLKLFGR